MERITTPRGVTVSFDTYGSGPPLVLVHGSFSDHVTNWQEAEAMLAERFSVYAVARRGRGESSATLAHSVADEAADVAAVLRHVGEPVFLLGHSHGALCALEAAALCPAGVRKLVLYEPCQASMYAPDVMARMDEAAEREDWDSVVEMFMLDTLLVPPAEVREIQASSFWDVWTVDARATMADLRAVVAHHADPDRYRALAMPVQLLIGTESPRELYLTDLLAAVLPDVRVEALAGQAHEGMTTAPEQFVAAISAFLLAESSDVEQPTLQTAHPVRLTASPLPALVE